MGLLTRKLELNDFVENTEPLKNPCRGMYCIHKFYVEQDMNLDNLQFDSNQSIVLVELNISAYRNGRIDEEGLIHIRQLFTKYQEKELNIILRVLYDFEGEGIKNEPTNLNIIKGHIEQLGVIFNEFKNLIFIIQGLFIGSWGEMHGTRFSEKYQHVLLYNALMTNSGSETYLAVRCPYMWRYITEKKVDQVSQCERLGLFNDGILGSYTDLGTYSEAGCTSVAGKCDREYEITFQNRLCQYVPNGGEILFSELSADKVNTIKTLEDMKITYLNSEHDIRIIDIWKNEKAFWVDSKWKDKSFYDYISEHIGYRFNLESCSGKYYKIGRKLKYRLSITNTGMAPCYQDVDVMLSFSAKDKERTVYLGTISKSASQEKMVLEGNVRIPGRVLRDNKHAVASLILKPQITGKNILMGNVKSTENRFNMIGYL